MKKILVPTDFSPNAARAIQYAVEIARRVGSTIYLIHSCDELMDPLLPTQERTVQEYNDRVIADAQKELDNLRIAIEDTEDILVNTQLYQGAVKPAILKAISEHDADLVIMGTLGKSGLREKILGSITASVMGKTPCPILSIPLEYDWSLPRKMLVALRDFEEAAPLLSPLFQLADHFGAELQVALFTDEDESTAVGFLEHSKEVHRWEQLIKRAHSELSLKAVHLSGHRFQTALKEQIENEHIDLLAMVTHSRNWLDQLFNRSLTKKMGYQITIPLLAIPAG